MAAKQSPDSATIQYSSVGSLLLDPKNPRLGRQRTSKGLDQAEVLDIMKDWTLEELGTSFCENGFWPQEALIAVSERVGDRNAIIVVEGNRRLAALKLIAKAAANEPVGQIWKQLVKDTPKKRIDELCSQVPYILKPDRNSVKSYLGFRHVTGIKEWAPAEKAQFITELIENDGFSYEEVRRKIGSKAPTVRQNYIAYRLLLQMETQSEQVDIDKVEDRFSVLYLSIRTEGVRKYLHIDIEADPRTSKRPVPQSKLRQLENFARWLFGDAKHEPLIADSRQIDDFGRILESSKAIEYLERTERPSFEAAKRLSGVSEDEVAKHVEAAADEAEEALRAAHLHKQSSRVRDAVQRLSLDTLQLANMFPSVLQSIKKELP